MERYNYMKSIMEDIKEYIINEIDIEEVKNQEHDTDLYWTLYDMMWVSDSITGNASGSYTFNTWQAEENICHNMDLLEDAFKEFGNNISDIEKGAEYCDVTIRCYLLGEALQNVLDEMGLTEE